MTRSSTWSSPQLPCWSPDVLTKVHAPREPRVKKERITDTTNTQERRGPTLDGLPARCQTRGVAEASHVVCASAEKPSARHPKICEASTPRPHRAPETNVLHDNENHKKHFGGTLERWFECLALRVCRTERFFCTHTQWASLILGFELVKGPCQTMDMTKSAFTLSLPPRMVS